MITIQGKGVSAGVGVGPLYYYRRATAEIKRYTVEDTDAEWHRFKGAQTGAVELIGGKELLYAAQGVMNRTYEAMFPLLGVAAIYLVLVMLFSALLAKFERRLAQSDRR